VKIFYFFMGIDELAGRYIHIVELVGNRHLGVPTIYFDAGENKQLTRMTKAQRKFNREVMGPGLKYHLEKTSSWLYHMVFDPKVLTDDVVKIMEGTPIQATDYGVVIFLYGLPGFGMDTSMMANKEALRYIGQLDKRAREVAAIFGALEELIDIYDCSKDKSLVNSLLTLGRIDYAVPALDPFLIFGLSISSNMQRVFDVDLEIKRNEQENRYGLSGDVLAAMRNGWIDGDVILQARCYELELDLTKAERGFVTIIRAKKATPKVYDYIPDKCAI
jgi:hypothetical protein